MEWAGRVEYVTEVGYELRALLEHLKEGGPIQVTEFMFCVRSVCYGG